MQPGFEILASEKSRTLGYFDNRGRRRQPKSGAEAVNVHDFPSQGVGKAIPYGTYEVTRDGAVVNVGITHETAEFAADSIRRWWQLLGRKAYPQARRLLICAEAWGSNGARLRAWKVHVQALVDRLGIAVKVCHYPPGTSKVDKVEHRLFSFISMNWRDRPLLSYEVAVNLIGSTTFPALASPPHPLCPQAPPGVAENVDGKSVGLERLLPRANIPKLICHFAQ